MDWGMATALASVAQLGALFNRGEAVAAREGRGQLLNYIYFMIYI